MHASIPILQGVQVIACIPYYQCRAHIRRAVESLLCQTHTDLGIIVMNDGDIETPPWAELEDINDPRLLRFDLSRNRGPYFALQVAASAIGAPFLLIQDADDRSHSERVAQLLAAIERDRSDLAVSAQPQFRVQGGVYAVSEVRWHRFRTPSDPAGLQFLLDTHADPQFRYRVPHAGFIRTETLRRLGGYFDGHRITSDVLLTNTILMAGRVSHVPAPLYQRYIRADSLTHSAATGNASEYAAWVRNRMAAMYSDCYARYTGFLKGEISSTELIQSIAAIRTRNVTAEDRHALAFETGRLLSGNHRM